MITTVLSFTLILVLLFLSGSIIIPNFFGAPWFPTSHARIQQALRLCGAKPGEILCDLGCGDGRVLITGVKEFGLKGIGVEIDPIKVWVSKWKVRRIGLLDKIKIIRKSVYEFDYSHVDILFIYLTHQAQDRLLPILKKKIKPGARIVCYKFCMKGVKPDQISKDGSTFLYRLNKGIYVNEFS